jgi:hypothetical protein
MTWSPDGVRLPSLKDWSIESLRLNGRRRYVARHHGITYIFAELEDGSWAVTKLKGGQILGEREFASMPRNLHAALGLKRRRRRQT